MAFFETDITIPVSSTELFEFMVQPANLKRISPPDMGLRFLDAPERFAMGSRFQFAVQTMGQLQKVTHVITQFQPSKLFVEELVEGPLPKWIHTHEFTPLDETRTLVRDQIEFEPPGGLIGLLMTESRILNHLEEGFYHRHQQLKKYFAT